MQSKHTRQAVEQKLLDDKVRQQLEAMQADNSTNTPATYSANVLLYPDHKIPFVDKHIEYLMAHPKLDTHQYLANLRMKIRIR